jgi:hypothetical protein
MSGRSLYRELVTFTSRAGEGAYGPVDGASFTLAANVQPGFKRIIDTNGQDVTASLEILLEADADGLVSVGDKAVWDSNTYVILSVQPIRLHGATDHVEVYGGPKGVGA